ncbi:MAG TPA: hypothetical protein VMA95_05180 [Streptosporangiaceae bacterium]|nr:hypothetical protein [Streptosporangiaceae bacterium]
MNAGSRRHDQGSGLVPHGLDFGATAPFVYDTLFGLLALQDQPPVEQYGRANPDARQAIFALSRTAGQAGVRVRDGGQAKDEFLEGHLRLYSAEEIWMFDLAIDVLAMLATGGGLHQGTLTQARDHLKRADEQTHSAHWRRAVHQAGAGPVEFRELRAHVPRRR